jgi:cellulose 1,4-beta-cellobiosidase
VSANLQDIVHRANISGYSGESDGTSDTTAARYDDHCGNPDALKPAPEAGQWFQAYFEQLLVSANPAF